MYLCAYVTTRRCCRRSWRSLRRWRECARKDRHWVWHKRNGERACANTSTHTHTHTTFKRQKKPNTSPFTSPPPPLKKTRKSVNSYRCIKIVSRKLCPQNTSIIEYTHARYYCYHRHYRSRRVIWNETIREGEGWIRRKFVLSRSRFAMACIRFLGRLKSYPLSGR